MMVLLDTNILLRLAQPLHSMHQPATDSIAALGRRGDVLCLVPQNIYEFWVVLTRPITANGIGFSILTAEAELVRAQKLFSLRHDIESILPQWQALIVKYQVSGKNAHDARLVAAMIVHGIPRILTFNTADFQRYKEIEAIAPSDVVNSQL